ncbi:MAG: hypothetical protein QOJ99_1838 [Bryobacterales bacterium]|jgi:uncharacterized damage-inducible protein DinB|nr:hypothetical protein [Bryobacterales bacterium]
MNAETLLITTAADILRKHTERIGICLGKLTDDQIWARGTENENAVGNLVLHLAGNVRQWIISGLGGKPDIRERDKEFATEGGIPSETLQAKLQETMTEAAGVVEGLTTEQLLRTYQVQNRTASGVEAVLRVTEHFAQHAGQIIYATKNLTGQDLGLVMPRTKK